MKRLTKQQRVARAVDRMESAAVALIRFGEEYAGLTWSADTKRKELFEKARLYASRVDAVSRARTRTISAKRAPRSPALAAVLRGGSVVASAVSGRADQASRSGH